MSSVRLAPPQEEDAMRRWSVLAMLVLGAGARAQAVGYGYQQRPPLPGDTLPLPPMNAAPPPRPAPENPDRWLEGVSVLFGGGVEGYTGSLSSRLAIGPAWTFILGIHPSSVFGIELAYQGGLQSLKNGDGSGNSGRADIIRHAGQANVTFAFGSWQVQPFVLAGVGIDHYSVSDQAKAVGFSEGTGGYVPVGGGIRFRVGGATMDLRGSWQLPFSDPLAPGGTGQNTLGLDTGNYRRWNASLNIGGTF
jgi:hypothetical protein